MLRWETRAAVAAVLAFALHGLFHGLLQLLIRIAGAGLEVRLGRLRRRLQPGLIVHGQRLSGWRRRLLLRLLLRSRRSRCLRLFGRLRSGGGGRRPRAAHRLQFCEGLLVERGMRRLRHAILV